MPKYAKRKKRNYRKKRRKARKKNPLSLYKQPFPSVRKVRFKYTEYGNLAPTSAAVGEYQFRANSMFDPNLTGTGDQPRWFDQMCTATLYNSFQVDSIQYKVTFINKGASDAICAVRFANNSNFPDGGPTTESLFHAGEFPRTTVRTILATGQDRSRTTFSGSQSLWPILAKSKIDYRTNSNYSGGYAANPDSTAYMLIYVGDNPQDSSGANIDWYVEITYMATMYRQRDMVDQS